MTAHSFFRAISRFAIVGLVITGVALVCSLLWLERELVLLRYTEIRLPHIMVGWALICVLCLSFTQGRSNLIAGIAVVIIFTPVICGIWYIPSPEKRVFWTFYSVHPGMTKVQAIEILEPVIKAKPWEPVTTEIQVTGVPEARIRKEAAGSVEQLRISGSDVYRGGRFDSPNYSADQFFVFFSDGMVMATYFGPD